MSKYIYNVKSTKLYKLNINITNKISYDIINKKKPVKI